MSDIPPANSLVPQAPAVPLTSFVGREPEIALVTTLLVRTDVRLLTLTGPGGIGKTRLAFQLADLVKEQFADSVVVVPLAPIRDPALVATTVAQILGVPDAPGHPLLTRLQIFLHDRHLLLLIDNAEHLLDATASLVAELLAQCPRLTVLSTSRTRLGISAEQVVPLDVLSLESARQLFVLRAQAVLPAFVATDEVSLAVDAICARLDRLPLAIELAASRTNVLPPAALLARLDHRLELLTGGPRDAPARQRTMRDTVAWSHDLLNDQEQRLFHRLGVFVGGFTLEAARAIAWEDNDVLADVSALVEASLVTPAQGVGDEPRFTMLETIREYALEQLAASCEEPLIRRRHARYFCSLAESAIPHYDGPALREFNDRVDRELDNCRAAMAWTLDNDEPETGIRLAGALWRVWWFGHAAGTRPWLERVNEGRKWLGRALEHREGLPVAVLAEALTGAGILARLQHDLEPGQAYGEELLARSQRENYAYGSFWALYMLGCTAEARGHDEEASASYQQAIAVAPAVGRPENHGAIPRVQLGRIAERSGDLVGAITWLERALALYRRCGNPHGVATASIHLGRVLRAQGELNRAAPLLHESLLKFGAHRDLGGVHASLVELALLVLTLGHPEQSARLLGAATVFPGHPNDVPVYEQSIEATKAMLSETEFAAAWEAGQEMSWDDVLAEVETFEFTVTEPSIDARPPAARTTSHGLTRREQEVLRLLAEGHTSRAIAEILSISERTVEGHVLHILTKLNLPSRAAAAAFAVRHNLA